MSTRVEDYMRFSGDVPQVGDMRDRKKSLITEVTEDMVESF